MGIGRRVRLRELVSGDHGHIARDMSFIFLFILLAKAVGAAKEMVVAWRYGTGPIVDAYLFVFNIVGIPVAAWYGVMYVVFIPLSARLASQSAAGDRLFRSELAGLTFIFGLVLAVILWAALRLLLAATTLGLEPHTHSLAVQSTDWLAFLIPIGIVANYGSVLLMAGRRHVNSLLEGAPALGLVLVLLLWYGSLLPLLVGTIGGTALQLLLTAMVLAHARILPRPRFGFESPAWRDFRAGIGAMIFAQLALSMTVLIDQLFAADLGSGSIATLGYASRILSLFLTLGATTIGRAMLPVFSRIRHSNADSLPRVAAQWTGWCFLGGIAALGIGWWLAEWLVRLLFERGAFTHQDTLVVADVLRWGLFQMPFYFALMVAQQALFSFSHYRIAAYLAGASLAIKILLSFLLVPAFGLAGLMIATAGMYAGSAVLLGYALVRLHRVRAEA